MTHNHGKIRDEDVEEIVRHVGTRATVRLTHRPTGTVAEETDADDLLARYKAWLQLRDALEGFS